MVHLCPEDVPISGGETCTLYSSKYAPVNRSFCSVLLLCTHAVLLLCTLTCKVLVLTTTNNKIQNSSAATSSLQLKDIKALTSPKLGFLHSFWLSFTRALQYPYIQGTSLKQHNKIQNSSAATSSLQLKDIKALTSPKLGQLKDIKALTSPKLGYSYIKARNTLPLLLYK